MLFEGLFHRSPCAGSPLAPNERQMLKIFSGLNILNCTSKLWITNPGCTNSNNLIGHELFKTDTWTPRMTPE